MSLNNTHNSKNINYLYIPNDTNNPGTEKSDEKKRDSTFECNICLDSPTDAVVSLCGHLFCWPCLHHWLTMKPDSQVCPVCSSAIAKETVVPIYGRENPRQIDPRDKVPPRPSGHRTERIKSTTQNSEYTVDSESETSSSTSLEDISIFSRTNFRLGNTSIHMAIGRNSFPFGLLPPISDILESRASTASTLFSEYMDDLNNSDNEN
ncbi:hypothetical protein ILUMI_13923 [Ignelater luminosus]|uniref:RING-type E3 ubiquitin transferase n=1 Tax=Ignelater luminosus TaxID=2038154 RepID=A0A8K0CRD8_IGNLU|nr:hypothetical protein ILUMI_13923 [Ignelater luminosus]